MASLTAILGIPKNLYMPYQYTATNIMRHIINWKFVNDSDWNVNKKPMGFMQSCCDLIIYFIYSL